MTLPSSELSRLVSHALRHEPWLYELELDEDGWVAVDVLLGAVRSRGSSWSSVDRSDLERMIAESSKRRHEIVGDQIRALYGHSVPGRIARVEAKPPEQLFHGTSPEAWAVIAGEGLRPMGRQYVHLSVDRAAAEQVGLRKAKRPVILTVHAYEAAAGGVRFWRGNEVVWLTEHIPCRFVSLAPMDAAGQLILSARALRCVLAMRPCRSWRYRW